MNKYPKLSPFGRLLILLVMAFWLGGLTFYAAVVIPTAHDVLGSHRKVGFITQRVTNWINVAGAVGLVILLVNLLISRCVRFRRVMIGLTTTWVVMAALQAGLFFLHPVLDRTLDLPARQVVDDDRFYAMHRVYLITTMIQQGAGLIHVFCLVYLWQLRDRASGGDTGGDGLPLRSPAR